MTTPSENSTATEELRAEHQIILSVAAVLETLTERFQRGDGFELEGLGQCVEFLRYFADACHHAKEEDLLFPLLESKGIPREGGPIGVMLYEHQIARRYTLEMRSALSAVLRKEDGAAEKFIEPARQYVELIRRHIHKEDTVLFDMGDGVMDEQDRACYLRGACDADCKLFGGKKREDLVAMAEQIDARWGDRKSSPPS